MAAQATSITHLLLNNNLHGAPPGHLGKSWYHLISDTTTAAVGQAISEAQAAGSNADKRAIKQRALRQHLWNDKAIAEALNGENYDMNVANLDAIFTSKLSAQRRKLNLHRPRGRLHKRPSKTGNGRVSNGANLQASGSPQPNGNVPISSDVQPDSSAQQHQSFRQPGALQQLKDRQQRKSVRQDKSPQQDRSVQQDKSLQRDSSLQPRSNLPPNPSYVQYHGRSDASKTASSTNETRLLVKFNHCGAARGDDAPQSMLSKSLFLKYADMISEGSYERLTDAAAAEKRLGLSPAGLKKWFGSEGAFQTELSILEDDADCVSFFRTAGPDTHDVHIWVVEVDNDDDDARRIVRDAMRPGANPSKAGVKRHATSPLQSETHAKIPRLNETPSMIKRENRLGSSNPSSAGKNLFLKTSNPITSQTAFGRRDSGHGDAAPTDRHFMLRNRTPEDSDVSDEPRSPRSSGSEESDGGNEAWAGPALWEHRPPQSEAWFSEEKDGLLGDDDDYVPDREVKLEEEDC